MKAKAPGTILVRSGTPDDKAAIEALLELQFPHDPNRLTEAEYRNLGSGGPLLVLVAESAGMVCGFVVLRDRHARPWTGIDFVGVAPHAKRKGVGKALMRAAVSHAPRPVLRLFAHASNSPARTLYASMGFRHISTKPSHYPNGEDAVVMMRWIGPRWLRRPHQQASQQGPRP
jgi:N6-L-threonylcarbamoyladenine synthase/ribosomal-protein-alanine N-acetyltransferase